ncbi:MAG: cupredoxin domain-containing protein [Solirubrobacteraceae bacterium]
MKTPALACALLAALALLAACGSDEEPGGAAPAPAASTPAPASAGPAADAAVVVKIKDFLYAPETVTVKKGARVDFENLDTAPHTATIAEGAMKFDSGTIEKGETKSVSFAKPGTYAYICLFHPYMKGTITVEG